VYPGLDVDKRLRRPVSGQPVHVDAELLTDRLRAALVHGSSAMTDRDALATLLDVHALHLAPIDRLAGAEEWQHEPRIAALQRRLERTLRARLDREPTPSFDRDPADAMRQLAHDHMVPPIYDWLAEEASRDELVEFVALEGGPDADFDDLVAICQVGLRGLPKVTLAANYWDEMGRGDPAAVHTELHHGMTGALAVRSVPVDDLPIEALERKALNGYLAVNRAVQPEMIGSLGMIECQAGARCRRVVAAMRRLEVPDAALPFYAEHAAADPHHGKDWLDAAVTPLVTEHPEWGPRIFTGAWWRVSVNHRFFRAMERRFDLDQRVA
jgi:hypothetical protein